MRIFYRLPIIILFALVCVWLTLHFGPWLAIPIWAGFLVVLCGAIGWLLQRQTPGRVTIINRLAGIVLAFGYKIGRGKLLPIVITSWFVWTLGGVGVIALVGSDKMLPANHSSRIGTPKVAVEQQTHAWKRVALISSWLVDSFAILYAVGVIISSRSASIPRNLAKPIGILSALLIASIALTLWGHGAWSSYLALLLAAGPPVLVGGGYGLFILAMLTVGRNARWN